MTRPPPELVSVVMPARNAAATIEQQLDALARQTYAGKWELVVVDNGSSDGTRAVVAGWTQRLAALRVLDASHATAPSAARNVGCRAARGELLLFCDADDVATERWIEAMVAAAERGDLIVGGLDHRPLNLPRRPWDPEHDDVVVPGTAPFGFLPIGVGANLGIWRDVLQALGGWNEAYGYGADDTELTWRAQLNGFTRVEAADAVMLYRHRPTLAAYRRQRFRRARAAAQLFKDFRAHGMPRPPIGKSLKTWASLVYRLPWALRSDAWRVEWVQRAAIASGRLTGSLQQRVLYL